MKYLIKDKSTGKLLTAIMPKFAVFQEGETPLEITDKETAIVIAKFILDKHNLGVKLEIISQNVVNEIVEEI